MKGIVMEKYADKLVVFTKEGEFVEIKNYDKSIDIGQEVQIKGREHSNHIYKRLAAIAAAVILFLIGGYGIYGYCTPYGYVNIDINPSVEISYNLFNKVLKITGLNEEGSLIIEKIDGYKFKSLDKVINKVVDSAVKGNYIKEEEENVVLLTFTEKGKEIDENRVYEVVNEHIKETKNKVQIIVLESNDEVYQLAKKDKISPGKLMLINEALEVSEDKNIEDMIGRPVKEIVNMIKENKKQEKNNQKNMTEEKTKNKKENSNKGKQKVDKEEEKLNRQNKKEDKNKENNGIIRKNTPDKSNDKINNNKGNGKEKANGNNNKNNNKEEKEKGNKDNKLEDNKNNKNNKDNKNNENNSNNKDNTKNNNGIGKKGKD